MDPKATDFSAQLAKIKASGGDTLFVTTAVEQATLILRQAKEQQVKARIITTGGSVSPDQLIAQAGEAANGSYHLVFFTPWFPDAVKNPDIAKKFVANGARKYGSAAFRGCEAPIPSSRASRRRARPTESDPAGTLGREGEGHQRHIA
jgi:branched-chain amino acid transport system substrate-binding protein